MLFSKQSPFKVGNWFPAYANPTTQRAIEFEHIPMNVVFSVFFCLTQSCNIYTNFMESFFAKLRAKQKEGTLIGTAQS